MLISFMLLTLFSIQDSFSASEPPQNPISISCNEPEQITLLPPYHQHQWAQACAAIRENNSKKFPKHYLHDLVNRVWYVQEPNNIQNYMTLAEYLILQPETEERRSLFQQLLDAGLHHTSSYEIEMQTPQERNGAYTTMHFNKQNDYQKIQEVEEKRIVSRTFSHQKLIFYAIMHTNASLFKQLFDQNEDKENLVLTKIEETDQGTKIEELSLSKFIKDYRKKEPEKRDTSINSNATKLGEILHYVLEHQKNNAPQEENSSSDTRRSCIIS